MRGGFGGVVGGRCPFCALYLTLAVLATYSNRGGRDTSRGKIRAILPSAGGRISIVALGGRVFGRRLIDGKGVSTQKVTSLEFRDNRIVTRV